MIKTIRLEDLFRQHYRWRQFYALLPVTFRDDDDLIRRVWFEWLWRRPALAGESNIVEVQRDGTVLHYPNSFWRVGLRPEPEAESDARPWDARD